jgi:hypothetical protein
VIAAVVVALAVSVGAPAAAPDEIASHYAGRQVHVVRGANGLDGWADQSGIIHLHEALFDSLYAPGMFTANRPARTWRAGRTTDASSVDAVALHTLLHEAMHLRHPAAPEGAVDCAAFLSYPGALQRYYGMSIGSPQAMSAWWYHPYPLDCGWFQ